MAISCTVIDAGARYGLHPSWADLRGLVDFHLFEMDAVEAARLSRKYDADPRVKVYPVALYSCDTTLRFKVRTHQALNSVLQSNDELLKENEYMLADFVATEEKETPARSIDSLFDGHGVDFLKLDTEGTELDILRGTTKTLASSVLGVRSEVMFAPVFKDAPGFGEIHQYLVGHGFELLNLDYSGAGNKAGKFTLPNRYGKLLSTDGVWIVGNDRLFAEKGDRLVRNVVLFAHFLFNNGATDLGVDVLLRAVTREGVSFSAVANDPLFRALEKKSLLLFKSLLGLPMLEPQEITTTYRTIFGREFPAMNKFYESDLLD
jgi:FkbM family methyltransferase